MGKHSFHLSGHSGKRGLPLNKRADCSSGGMYKSPAVDATVKAEEDFVIAWDTSCMSPAGDSVDISLFSTNAGVDQALVHQWREAAWSRGSFTTKIDPSWYGSTSSVSLQVMIADSSLPPFLSDLPAGPRFNVTFDAKAALSASIASASASAAGNPTPTTGALPTTTSPASRWEYVRNWIKHGMSKGQIAAAVIMPILAVAAFLIAYVIWNRKKETSKRKEWREKMDQRMSTISVDWKAMSAAGGHAAVRQSMAFSTADRNTRTSSFFGRPGSQFVAENGEMRQARPSMTSTATANRVSRVSFAAESYGRPSESSRPAVPPLPAAYRKSTLSYFDEQSPEGSGNATPEQGAMSPTQREGAFVLDDDSIRDRLSANNPTGPRDSAAVGDYDNDLDTMPAIAMMRNQASPAVYQTQPALAEDPSSPITPLTPALTREPAAGNHRVYSIGAYSAGTDSMVDNGSVQSYFSQAPPSQSDPDQALRQYAARAATQPTASPFAGFASGPGLAQAAGLDMSSPDAIFRAYAATRPAQPPAAATATPTGNVMRTLYGPNMAAGLMRPRADTLESVGTNNPYRNSMAPRHSDDVGKAN